MATNPNMVAIQTVTVGSGGASSITFSNIPQTYTDLVILVSARTDRAGAVGDNLSITYNGSSVSQSDRRLYADGSGAYSYTDSALYAGIATASSATASTFGSTAIYIPNYTSSNNKSSSSDGVAENNGTATAMNLGAELWSNTAAITQIAISSRYSATLQQYSTATLYGITNFAGNQTGAYATGGTVTTNGQYWYHTFTSSGTFTPNKNLSCDYLVVAGGGGGGRYDGGGGGGGGFVTKTETFAYNTAFTVTVGSGGSGGSSPTNGNDSSISGSTGYAYGGGRGGARSAGANGGSGGGGNGYIDGNPGGNPVTGQGNSGGSGINASPSYSGGGGGGAGAAGGNGTGAVGGGVGGAGLASSISGSSVYYAGGGGAGQEANNSSQQAGGVGGGGSGGNTAGGGTAGAANTGGGGGGGGSYAGAAGGSGIVIIRYSVNS